MKQLPVYLILVYLTLISSNGQNIDFFLPDTVDFGNTGLSKTSTTSTISSINLTGSIDIMVLIIAFPDRTNSWPEIYNNNSYYPQLGTFPDGTLLTDYIDANGPIDEAGWTKSKIERYYDVHSGGRFTVNVTIPQRSDGKCFTSTNSFSYWISLNGSSDNVIWNYWNEIANEAAQNLLLEQSNAFNGIEMVQIMFVDVSKNEYHTQYSGRAFPGGITLHEPSNPSNIYFNDSGGHSRTAGPILHESLHVFGKAAGSPSGFDGLPDRGYDRPFDANTFNATSQFDIMYHNSSLNSQYALFGTFPMLTHDLLYLGWIDATEIETITSTSEGLKIAPITFSLNTSQISAGQRRVYKVMIDENYSGNLDEYFLIEFKNGLEFDRNLHNLDESLYNTGILIWHIKEKGDLDVWQDNLIDLELAVPYNGYHGNPIPNDAYPRNYSRPSTWGGRHGDIDWLDDIKMHKVYGLTQYYYMPDGGRHYWETTVTPAVNNYGWDPTGGYWFFRQSSLKSDFYSDDIIKGFISDKFTPNTRPSSQDWNGLDTHIAICNIKRDNGYMTFDVYYNYWGGLITSNTTWTAANSPYYIGENLTIDVGAILTIEEGTVVKFLEGKNLIVNGIINSQGNNNNKIYFQGLNSADWGSVKLYGDNNSFEYCVFDGGYMNLYLNSSSGNNISYCEFKNGENYGLRLYNSDADIDHSYVHHNDGNGVSMGYASGLFLNNTIENNEISGINCTGYCEPDFALYNQGGYNIIKNNSYDGLLLSYYSDALLGLCSWQGFGHNSIYDNNNYDLKAYSYSDAYAPYNWWGVYPPSSSQFYCDPTSSLNRNYPLSSFPGGGSPLAKTTIMESEIFDPAAVEHNDPADLYELARYYRYLKTDYPAAMETNKEIVTKFPQSFFSIKALTQLFHLSNQGKIGDINDYLNTLLDKKLPNETLGSVYNFIILQQLKKDKLKEAETLCNEVIDKELSDFSEMSARYHLVVLYNNQLKDEKTALEQMNILKEKYPNQGLTLLAQEELGFETDWSLAKYQNIFENSEFSVSESALPVNYALSDNYPNPFNPNTTVEYALPKNSAVVFTIYNTLGQVVKKSTYNSVLAGVHPFVWDGKNNSGADMSSGLYILHFKAQSLEDGNETFNKSIKLLLVR